MEKCLESIEKDPFGVDGHALKYTNEVGILKFRTEETNCNYEINYQVDATEYLFALSSFSSTCFGHTRPSSGAIGVKISYKCSIWW